MALLDPLGCLRVDCRRVAASDGAAVPVGVLEGGVARAVGAVVSVLGVVGGIRSALSPLAEGEVKIGARAVRICHEEVAVRVFKISIGGAAHRNLKEQAETDKNEGFVHESKMELKMAIVDYKKDKMAD